MNVRKCSVGRREMELFVGKLVFVAPPGFCHWKFIDGDEKVLEVNFVLLILSLRTSLSTRKKEPTASQSESSLETFPCS
jgi:hypothetical protein